MSPERVISRYVRVGAPAGADLLSRLLALGNAV
jgi:hypothetical protein